jgi:activating signal cointegrator 1
MKALTLTQPWATLVAIGAKRIETRGWKTPYRGPLAIHAAKGFPADCRDVVYKLPFRDVLGEVFPGGEPIDKRLPLGAVIAIANLVDCERTELFTLAGYGSGYRLTEQEMAFGNYADGRWAWTLKDVVALPEPIQAKGMLSLWDWKPPSWIKE